MLRFSVARDALAARMPRPPLADSATTQKLRPVVVPQAQQEPRPLVWRPVVVEAFWMWLASRVAMVAFTFAAVLMLRPNALAQGWRHVSLRTILYAWKQWDGYWYTEIAHQGYWQWQTAAFFPLYPTLIRAASLVAGTHWLALAMIIANVAALGAFAGIGLLAANEQGSRRASARVMRVFAAYPLAFFLTAPYTEGMFIAFAAFTLLFARRGLWRWAALTALLAGLTRPTSVVLVLPIFWEFGRQHGWWDALADVWHGTRKRGASVLAETRSTFAARGRGMWDAVRERRWADVLSWREALSFVLLMGAVPCAFGLFIAYLWHRFRHPLLFLYVQRYYWHRANLPLWRTIPLAIHQFLTLTPLSFYQVRDLVDDVPIVLFALVTLIVVRRQPFAFTLYMAGLLYLAVATPVMVSRYPDMFQSAGRFLLAAIPLFLVLGRWTRGRPALDLLLVGGGFLLQAVLAAFFLTGGWLT
ncbi:MAG TPA: hypothetical protein VGS80_14705 [Ktedonobacterales bacterium]|nr:hypothetical protein [Ktedonobacterales bacterium]